MFESLFSTRGLSFERLKTLLEVQGAGSIAAAAPDSSSRQSQYSYQLRELAAFFGAELTQRAGKRLQLTPTGEQVAALAQTYFTALTDLRAECQAAALQYRIVAGESLLQWLIVPRLRPLTLGKSKATFSTVNVRTSEAVHQIQEARADFGVVRKDSVPRGVKSAPLGRLRFGGAYPKSLAHGTTLTVHQLLSLPLALMTTDGQFTSRLRTIARAKDTQVTPAIACQSFPQVLGALRSGRYATIVPTLAFDQMDQSKVCTLESDEFKALSRELVLIWNDRMLDVRPGAGVVLDFLRSALVIA